MMIGAKTGRFVNAIGVLLMVPLLTFFLLGRAPGDYLSELAANPQISAETLAHLRVQYGLDQPFYIKFWHWASTAAHGDFGYSFVYQRPIRDLLSERIGNTLLLNGVALSLAWLLGIVLGAVAAWFRKAGWWIGSLSTLLTSTPSVVLSLLLLGLALRLGLPVGGMTASGSSGLLDLLRHLLLPAAAVTAVLLPSILRHTETAVAESLQSPYIATARAKGLTEFRILFHHALRNALNPLTTLFGYSISALLSASLVVEIVMNWPGIGQLTFDAVIRRDIFLVVDLTVLSAFLLLAGNVIGDLLLHFSDPRTRES